jgi:hypothetical protein
VEAAAQTPETARGQHPGQFDRLVVLWRDYVEGTRYQIGQLWRLSNGQHAFAYLGFESLGEAFARGFTMLQEFPAHKTDKDPYVSRYLFPTFAHRIPSPRRPDFYTMVTAWGVERVDDAYEILARSGGRRLTDGLELAEYRPDDDPLAIPLEFRIAGARHYPGSEHVEQGMRMALRREPDNAWDPFATMVLTPGGIEVGHVPRLYSRLVAWHLDGGRDLEVEAVRRLVLPAPLGRWVFRVRSR